jgi:2-polyprenyl-3-methyl-5-hydroxy-6-metoxy-1,4-benzoquinol methylase
MSGTREPQYQDCLDLRNRQGVTPLGLSTGISWHDDPKRLAFTFARYKFVAKMFDGLDHVLEVGCGDGFCTRVVLQAVKRVTAIDFDPLFVDDCNARMEADWKFDCKVHDMLSGPVPPGNFDGAYSLDVLEHIEQQHEETFVGNAVKSLGPHGVFIVGMPSLESQSYASPRSKAGHVNCKSAPVLKKLMEKFFHRVFMFSMNDEIVHTGFHPLAHYIIALCCERK